MKFFGTVALLALAGSTLADLAAVEGAVAQWTNDVNAVDFFLNNILASGQPAQDAVNVLPTAQDEPNQLAILQANLNPADANGLLNVEILMQNFPTVVGALNNIANSQNNPDIVRANVAVINSIRCGVVLKNIGQLFANSLNDNGVGTFTFPAGPNVCPASDGNGNFAVVAPLL